MDYKALRESEIDNILKVGRRAVYLPRYDAEYQPPCGYGRYIGSKFVYEKDRRLIQIGSSDRLVDLEDEYSIISALVALGDDSQNTDRELYALTICAQNKDVSWLQRIAETWPKNRVKIINRKY